jgi:phosphatidylglycerol:prolipoprotein diacylglycerol transferase
VLTQPVFPTSLYESVICLSMFAALWLIRNKIKKPGGMFFIFILSNGIERFFIEFIKTNPLYCIQKICLTQAQFIALLFCLLGISGLTWLKMKKDI